MADRATRPEDTERQVFDLEKDERWQARLAEARVRREIALREKANSETPPKRRMKPWEADGQGDLPDFEELEALLAPEDDGDRLDFADRVKSLRKSVEPEQKRQGDNGGPSLGGRQERVAPPTEMEELPEEAAGDSDPVEETPRPRSGAVSVADRYIKALSPDFTPVRPFVPESHGAVGFTPSIVSETLSADDSEKIAREYASTMKADVAEVEPAPAAPVAKPRAARRRGVPLLLLAGVCALAVLPFSTTVPPLQKGPISAVPTPAFGLQPALGITRPMNAIPVPTRSGEWVPVTKRAPGRPFSLPFDVVPTTYRSIAPLPEFDPGDAGFGPFVWASVSPVEAERVSLAVRAPFADRLPGVAAEVPAVAVDAAEETPPLPEPLSILRVTLLVPQTADEGLADGLVEDLELRGHEIGAVKTVNLKISERNLRFFHEEDRGEAARLAEAYGARLRDFTNFRPSPSEGTVEIWLAGEGVPAGQPAPRPAPQFEAQQVVPVPRVVIVQRQPSFLERLTGGLIGAHEGDGLPDPSYSEGTSAGGSLVPSPDGTVDGTGATSGTDPSDVTGTTGTDTGATPDTGSAGSTGGSTGGVDSSTGGAGTSTGGTGAAGGDTGSSTGGTQP